MFTELYELGNIPSFALLWRAGGITLDDDAMPASAEVADGTGLLHT